MSQPNVWERKIAPALRKCSSQTANRICRVILELSGNDTREIQAIISANQGTLHQRMNIIPALVVEIPLVAIEALAKSGQVKRIWQDTEIKTSQRRSFT